MIAGMRAVALDLSTQGFTPTRGYPVNFAVQAFSNTRPALTQPQWFPGQFQFQLSGESGRSYRIDATMDFASWATLGTNSAFGGSFSFIDTNAPGFGKRFYRAVLVP